VDSAEPTVVAVAQSGADPVKWFVIDGWCEPEPGWTVPGPDWPGWEVHYTADVERGKRTTRHLWGWVGERVERLQSLLTLWECARRFGFVALPDPSLHGGGVHVMPPGSDLGCHIDYDRHPNREKTPYIAGTRRAVNLIAFCHPRWEAGWGGEFYLADTDGNPVVTLEPKPGRLVAFETNDLSYHGVLPVTGPAERVSVAVYLLEPAGPGNVRTRAMFLPRRG
jgi:hypothetical protein